MTQENGRIIWVSYARVFVILTLVLMHSFAIYSGDWELPEGVQIIKLYPWIHDFLFSALLETFTFISGYLFALSIMKAIENGRPLSFFQIVKKKFLRLIIPCWLFGIFYELLFSGTNTIGFTNLLSILYGSGHLWYLPMLFWCFIITSLLNHTNINRKLVLLGCFLLSLLGFFNAPFQIGATFYYLFFFYLGYCFRLKQISLSPSAITLILLFFIYIFIFTCLNTIYGILLSQNSVSLIDKTFYHISANLLRVVYSSFGLFLIFWVANRIACSIKTVPFIIKRLDLISFSIYIVHQFVLKFIYFYTSIPSVVDSACLPWISFSIALFASIAISLLLKKIPFIKNIVG